MMKFTSDLVGKTIRVCKVITILNDYYDKNFPHTILIFADNTYARFDSYDELVEISLLDKDFHAWLPHLGIATHEEIRVAQREEDLRKRQLKQEEDARFAAQHEASERAAYERLRKKFEGK